MVYTGNDSYVHACSSCYISSHWIDVIMRSSRREFLVGCASVGVALSTPASLRADPRPDIRITRIVAFDLPSKRNKVAGKNARLDVHGDSAVDPVVRIYTNAEGVEGLGVCRASKEKLAE